MIFYILILAIIQGITEFLPISSSAHLVAATNLFGVTENVVLLDIALHLGSLIAIFIYYKEDISKMIYKTLAGKVENNLSYKVVAGFLGFLPVASICFLFLFQFESVQMFRDSWIVLAIASIVFSIILYFSDKKKITKKIDELTLKEAFIIGLFQSLSIIPGVSRSGITVTKGRYLGLSRKDAVEFSLMLAIPTILIAGIMSFLKVVSEDNFMLTYSFIAAIVLSFVFSYISLIGFVKYIKKASFTPFVIYRILMSVVIIALVIAGII